MTARTYNEMFERPHHLQLERESADFWIVTDRWNPDTVMMRSADVELCRRFMAAFAEKEGATYDVASVEHSWRVAQDALSEGTQERRSAITSVGRGMGRDADGSVPSENVYPLFHAQVDEAS